MSYDAHAVTHVPPNTQGGKEKRERITNKRQHYEYKFFPEQVSGLGIFVCKGLRGGGDGPKVQPPPRAFTNKKIPKLTFNPPKFRKFSHQNHPPPQPRHNSPWGTPPDSRPFTTYSTCKL